MVIGSGWIFDFGIGTVGGGGSVSTLGTDARMSGPSFGVVGGSISGGLVGDVRVDLGGAGWIVARFRICAICMYAFDIMLP